MLDDQRGLAVVAVIVCDELAAAIGTQVFEAKCERHEKVLHEFDQSRQCIVLRRHEVDRLKLYVMIGGFVHEAVVSVRRGRHGTQEVGADDLKPLRDLGITYLGGIGYLVPFVILQMLHTVNESVKMTPVSAMFCATFIVRSLEFPRRWCEMFAPCRRHSSCRHRRRSGGSGSIL